MKKLHLLFILVLFSCTPKTAEKKGGEKNCGQVQQSGWELLFDGKTTAGWRGINSDSFPETGWEIKNGELVVNATDGTESGNGGDIITVEKFGDFELQWEWKMFTKGGNSGLKYYVKEMELDNKKHGIGLEYQILDDENHPWMLEGKMKPCDYYTIGSLYEIYEASCNKKPSPLGEWNKSRIISKNNHVEHWLNGEKILEYERGSEDFRQRVAESKFKKYENFGEADEGHILIQDHGSIVHYRNIKIKEMK